MSDIVFKDWRYEWTTNDGLECLVLHWVIPPYPGLWKFYAKYKDFVLPRPYLIYGDTFDEKLKKLFEEIARIDFKDALKEEKGGDSKG